MSTDTGNLFESLPVSVNEELFTDIVRGENVTIERIVSNGHSSPASGWYDQEENEWVVVLQGAAKLAFEGKKDVYLESGHHLNIPAHTRHRVLWTTPDTQTIWLAVHYK